MKYNFTIPAKIEIPLKPFSFETEEGSVSKIQLKVFYKGTTPDHRTFTDEFSEKLLTTLPNTPVVAYYDEDKEDFLGHNGEQYVYGFVPEAGEYTFEEIDGATWAVTDISLFTQRNDNIGEVARKIVGKQHSLELNPDTVEYEIITDDDGKFKELIFKEGDIIGLSVLGDDQAPGFTGSEFFERNDIKSLIAKYSNISEKILHSEQLVFTFNDGGAEMNFDLETLAKMNSFMRKTYDEKMQEVFDAVYEAFGSYTYVVQISEDAAVFLDYETGNYYRASYTANEEGYEFGEKVVVKPRFLTEEEINSVFTLDNLPEGVISVDGFTTIANNATTAEGVTSTSVGYLSTEFLNTNSEDITTLYYQLDKNNFTDGNTHNPYWSITDYTINTEPDYVSREEFDVLQEKYNELEKQSKLDAAEKAELERFRLEEKRNFVNEYKETLTEEEFAVYTDEEIAKYSITELETKIALVLMKKLKNEKNPIQMSRMFKNTQPVEEQTAEQKLVEKYK